MRRKFFLLFVFISIVSKNFIYSESLNEKEISYGIKKIDFPNRTIKVNSVFTVYFDISCADPREVDILNYDKNPNFTLHQYPLVYAKNWREHSYQVRIRYRARKTGRFYFGGFIIKTPEWEQTIPEQLVEVGISYKRTIRLPVEFVWETEKTTRFQDEVFLVHLKAINSERSSLEMPPILNQIKLASLKMEEIKVNTDLEVNHLFGKDLYSFIVKSYLVSFSEAGQSEFPEITCKGKDFIGTVLALPIRVESLSLQSAKGNPAGYQFDYQYRLNKEEVYVGDSFKVLITLSGVGNLNKVILPNPSFGGLVASDPKIRKSYVRQKNGYMGYQNFIWTLKAEKVGTYSIRIPDFNWLDLKSGKVQWIGGKTYSVKVQDNLGVQSEELKTKSSLELLPIDQVLKGEVNHLFLQSGNYLLFLPAVIMFFLGIIFLYHGKKMRILSASVVLFFLFLSSASPFEQQVQKAYDFWANKEFQEAYDSFESALKLSKGNAALYYNAAVCADKIGLNGNAIYNIAKARYYSPTTLLYRRLENALEDRYNLYYQFSSILFINLDLFFILTIIGVNLSALIFLLMIILKKRQILIILFSFAVIATIGISATFLAGLISRMSLPAIVVAEDQSIRRIHSETSPLVFTVPAGTSLKVIGEYNDYYIVKNSLGVDGWIRKDYLKLLDQ